MTDSSPSESLKATIAVAAEVLKIARENPDLRAAGTEIGKAALTVTTAINVALLPLAALNYAVDKAKHYFETRFPGEMASKLEEIPEGALVEPKASVAGPALTGLAFTHDEADLKEMYLSLLATSMDSRVASKAHPAFAEVIRQMTRAEASTLRDLLEDDIPAPIAELSVVAEGQLWSRYRHLFPVVSSSTGEPVRATDFPSMIDNFCRMGLIDVQYRYGGIQANYEWVFGRPEYVELRDSEPGTRVHVTHGTMFKTRFGARFAEAVGIRPVSAPLAGKERSRREKG